jgi:hypothetical protein
MGFGTLFTGFILLLNMVQPAASDAFAGFIILLALLKLSQFNINFLRAKWFAIAFSVIGVIELPLFCLGMILPEVKTFYEQVDSVVMVLRFALLAVMTLFILLGIEGLAKEVELSDVPRRAKFLAYANIAVRGLFSFCYLPIGIPYVVYAVAIFLEFILVLTMLFVIWRCYMMICMPEDINGKKQKHSRFAFVNEYRARQEEKEREMQEYRLEQMKKKSQKKSKKKK